METTAFSAVITGSVQGVGFRWTAAREAERLGLKGWVKNTIQGDVEVWAEGPKEKTDAFLAWLRLGPPHSRVDEVRVDWSVPHGGFKRFSIDQFAGEETRTPKPCGTRS